jgi:hypothetical protein
LKIQNIGRENYETVNIKIRVLSWNIFIPAIWNHNQCARPKNLTWSCANNHQEIGFAADKSIRQQETNKTCHRIAAAQPR